MAKVTWHPVTGARIIEYGPEDEMAKLREENARLHCDLQAAESKVVRLEATMSVTSLTRRVAAAEAEVEAVRSMLEQTIQERDREVEEVKRLEGLILGAADNCVALGSPEPSEWVALLAEAERIRGERP